MIIRKAVPDDAAELAALLNEIIRAGRTTAIETELAPAEFYHWFISGPEPLCCHVAEANGPLYGFQSLSVYDVKAPGWADIATFARIALKKSGLGRALFTATKAATSGPGISVINATIRAGNISGLGYYGKMGLRIITGWWGCR